MDNLLAAGISAPLQTGDLWGDGVLSDLNAMPASESKHWHALLSHAMMSDAAKPSAKWLKQARPLVEAINQDAFLERLKTWATL